MKKVILLVLVSINLFGEKFTLITTLFNERDRVRIDEYVECISRNHENEYIEKIFILFEDNQNFEESKKILKKMLIDKKFEKVELIFVYKRPSFQDVFLLANQQGSDKFIIFCNADIYFDSSLHKLKRQYFDHSLICLSRYDFINNKWQSANNGFRIKNRKYKASFDSWLFKTPFHLNISDEFIPGTWGCEKFASIALDQGYSLKNPSKDIHSFHLHGSMIRHYLVKDKYSTYRFVYLPEVKLSEEVLSETTWCEINGFFSSKNSFYKKLKKIDL